jgi:hypothetical protein
MSWFPEHSVFAPAGQSRTTNIDLAKIGNLGAYSGVPKGPSEILLIKRNTLNCVWGARFKAIGDRRANVRSTSFLLQAYKIKERASFVD